MDEKFSNIPIVRYVSLALITIGVLTIGFGLYFEPDKTWANFLLNNYYFTSIAIGATFFLALQYITQSGWSALFIRIPHAIGAYLPIAGVLMLFLIFGMASLYHWSSPDAALHDPLIEHKSPYLNVPLFFIRLIVFFGIWTVMTVLLKKISIKEDVEGGLHFFNKSELYSKVYIFIVAITFSLATFDLIMSIDVHWFSTIFAVKNFVSGLSHAVAVITLIVILLNNKGYFNNLNKSHLHDFSRYIFMLSTVWAYLWFVQYLLIWYTNIPEETVYYVIRTKGKWRVFFFLNIIMNWGIPFSALLWSKVDSNKTVLVFVIIVLLIGQWIDLYLQIMPGSVGEFHIGYIEIGTYAGFIGLFALAITRALSKMPLIPKNHPYLNESINHRL